VAAPVPGTNLPGARDGEEKSRIGRVGLRVFAQPQHVISPYESKGNSGSPHSSKVRPRVSIGPGEPAKNLSNEFLPLSRSPLFGQQRFHMVESTWASPNSGLVTDVLCRHARNTAASPPPRRIAGAPAPAVLVDLNGLVT